MDTPREENGMSVASSLLGIVVAIPLFVVTWFLGYALFARFDHVRGLGNAKLQALFREMLVPGEGSVESTPDGGLPKLI